MSKQTQSLSGSVRPLGSGAHVTEPVASDF